MGPSPNKWCEFYRTNGHTTKNCRTLQSQFENLICSGHLGHFVQEEYRQSKEPTRKGRSGGREKEMGGVTPETVISFLEADYEGVQPPPGRSDGDLSCGD
ncbi:hypothetical protein CR513_54025, partial [Mucuna pruriens]